MTLLREPLRILLLAANPSDTGTLRLGHEARKIKEALEKPKAIVCDLQICDAARPEDLRFQVLSHKPHFVHFSGHGAGEAGIVLEDDGGAPHLVPTEALEFFFDLFKEHVRCVFLNCCYSQPQAEAIARHIPFVIGTREEIPDKAAVEFSVAFYEAIGQNKEIPQAVQYGIAALKLKNLLSESRIPFLVPSAQILEPVPEHKSHLAAVTQRPNPAKGDTLRGVSSDVLKTLRKRVQNRPSALRRFEPVRDLQLFEVLTAHLLALAESDFEWDVDSLQGDEGIGFYGERTLFAVPGLEDRIRMVIAGQCRSDEDAINRLTIDLLPLLNAANPSLVILAIAIPIAKESILKAQQRFLEETRRQCCILGLDQIHRLIKLYYSDVVPFLDSSLTAEEQDEFAGFFQGSEPDDIIFKVDKSERVLAGVPFVISVRLQTALLLKKPIRVRWTPQPGLLLIRPVDLTVAAGLEIESGNGFSIHLSLKLISYSVGVCHLGELVFDLPFSAPVIVPLGTIIVADQYHPIFFWEPFHHHRLRFQEVLEQVKGSSPAGIGVVGQGGTGKTRLSQELGYLSEQQGGKFISLSHPQNLEQPYRIFGFLTQALIPRDLAILSPKEALETYLQSFSPQLYQRARPTIAAAFSAEVENRGKFDREAMIQMLLVLLLLRLQVTAQVVHLCDLHWASTETLDILGELLIRLKRISETRRCPVLLVFEGRVQTNIAVSREPGETPAVSTAVFESFLERFSIEKLVVQSLDSKQSEGFLHHLFETTQSSYRRVQKALIPHQETLIAEIARYGRGNPFHLVEQVKLLRHKGVIQRNERTGLLFLCERPNSYPVPASVQALITLRLDFIEDTVPDLALLIKSVGLIKDRVDMDLFRELKSALAGSIPDHLIQNMEMLNTENQSEVGFLHENYYEVVHGLPLNPEERQRITRVYLNWYERTGSKSAQRLYEQASVHLACTHADHRRVKNILSKALDRAEEANQYQLELRILRTILSIGQETARHPLTILERLKNAQRLARIAYNVESWKSGAEGHEKVIKDIDLYLEELRPSALMDSLGDENVSAKDTQICEELMYMRTTSVLSLANCNTDLGQSHISISLLEKARRTCGVALTSPHSKSQLDQWGNLYVRVLNRLGEANWMDGNYDQALVFQEQALSEIKNLRPKERKVLQHINLMDYGYVLLHKDPEEAVSVLKRGARLLTKGKSWPPRYAILAGTTLALGEMVRCFISERGVSRSFQEHLQERTIPQLKSDFEKAQFYGFKQELVAASLTLAVSLSLLADPTSSYWYMEAIETGFRSHNFESLWRAHLNLAQDLLVQGDIESTAFHSARAQQLLLSDIQRRNPDQRKWKLRHLQYPIVRIASLHEACGQPPDCEMRELLKELPTTIAEPGAPSKTVFRDKLVFLWHQGNQYFLYGG